MRRSEIFWRTFCGDSSNRQSPAPEEFGQHFTTWLITLMIFRTFNKPVGGFTFTKAQLDRTLGGRRWQEKFPWVEKMLWDDLTTQFDIDQAFDAMRTPQEAIKMKYIIQPFMKAYLDWHCSARGHFSCVDGTYGIGPLSMEAGDEIWIVAGEPVPCVLRPVSGDRYEFVGEAYIHGIMKGELADCGLLKPTRDLVLI